MAKAPGSVVDYDEGNSPMMLHDPLNTLSGNVMWQIKRLISAITQCLSGTKLIWH